MAGSGPLVPNVTFHPRSNVAGKGSWYSSPSNSWLGMLGLLQKEFDSSMPLSALHVSSVGYEKDESTFTHTNQN